VAFTAWLRAALGLSPSDSDASPARLDPSFQPGSPVVETFPPFDGVLYIIDEIGGLYYQGTGVLISPDEVLTASHVVFTAGDAVATNVEVSTGYNGTYSLLNSAGTVTHYNAVDDGGDTLTLEQSQKDYAIIHLSTPFTGTTRFALLSNYADTLPSQAGTATVSGYPGSADGEQLAYSGDISVEPGYTIYGGASLGPGSSGGPVWITDTDGQPTVVGLVSTADTDDPDSTSNGNDLQITTPVLDQIAAWVAEDDHTPTPLTVLDTSNGDAVDPQPTPYSGPVAGLSDQYINVATDDINVTANTRSWFIHTGSGEDAIAASSGTNVLDGGTGSNFLVGGTGTDTFFTDDRGAPASIWDTLVNFHAGDAATVFGVTEAGFTLDWVDGQGAAGYTGLTLHATVPGKPEASVTLAGFDSAALTDGKLTISFGTTNGSPYMYIHDNF
jgi:V8-like Glu-specific endopeptidase